MHKVSLIMTLVLAAALAACGGGSDDEGGNTDSGGGGGGGGGTALTCNTANYTAGAVSVATSADLSAYAGTFNGEEGTYDVNFNFVKSADVQMVLSGSGTMSYKGITHAVTSYCVDNTAGPYGKLLYIEFANGHFDISLVDAGAGLRWAWGVAPDGKIFRSGVKQ